MMAEVFEKGEVLDIVYEAGDECMVCKIRCSAGGVYGGPNGPKYPPCAYSDDWVDEEKLRGYFETYLSGR